MAQLEDLHADQTNLCFYRYEGEGWEPVKLA